MEKEEYKKFNGSWVQTSCNSDGIENPNEVYGLTPIVTFNENTFLVASAEGAILIKGTFSLNTNATPKEINWTDTYGNDAGKTFPAIKVPCRSARQMKTCVDLKRLSLE